MISVSESADLGKRENMAKIDKNARFLSLEKPGVFVWNIATL